MTVYYVCYGCLNNCKLIFDDEPKVQPKSCPFNIGNGVWAIADKKKLEEFGIEVLK